MKTSSIHSILFLLATVLASRVAAAECAAFYDGLNSIETSQSDNAGEVFCLPDGQGITMIDGVNHKAALFNGDCFIRFAGEVFKSSAGTISLWFQRATGVSKCGIVQIGDLTAKNSIGVFYDDGISCGFRGDDDVPCTTHPAVPIPEEEFTHIAIKWFEDEDGFHVALFINGEYAPRACDRPVSFVADKDYMDVGYTSWYGYCNGAIDEIRFFTYALSDDEVRGEYLCSPYRKPVSTGVVKVVGKELFVNGELFSVKGVGYQPVPIGFPNNEQTRAYVFTDPDIRARDVAAIRRMGANTVRLWARLPDCSLLDALWNEGQDPIYAILGYEIDLTKIGTDNAAIEQGFREYVEMFMHHPAILGWGLGNEVNFHYTGNMNDWFSLANRLAEVAFEAEGLDYHPTIIVNSGMKYFGNPHYSSDDVSLLFVDMWGHNAYASYDYGCYFDYYHAISAKPLVVTEYGVDAWDARVGAENECEQARWVLHEWDQIRQNSCGGTLMSYSDEYWKADPEDASVDLLREQATEDCESGEKATVNTQPDACVNEEWWGAMRPVEVSDSIDEMQPRKVYHCLRLAWTGSLTSDVTGDCKVDILDLMCVADHLYEEVISGDNDIYDLTGDGRINILDLIHVRNHLDTSNCQ